MKTSAEQLLFDPLFNAATKSRILIGVAIVTIGLIGFARAATDFCQNTAQDALDGCQDAAEGAQSVAMGKCANISDPTARGDCRKQAAADFTTRSKPVGTGLRRARLPARNLAPPDMIR